MNKVLTVSIVYWMIAIWNPLYADQLSDLVTGESDSKNIPQADKIIEVDSTEQDDKKIQKRLEKIFSEMQNLQHVKILVSNGIVTLQGNISSSSAEEKALQLSQQIQGVVEVENNLVVTHNLQERLETTWQKLIRTAKEMITGFPVFLLAIMTFALSWLFGRWLSRRQSLYRKIAPNYFIASLLGQITQLLFILFGLVLALSFLDLTAILGSILGAAGIVGLAIGFAVRDTVENYIASILLSLRNPFEVNDLVNIDGNEGNVIRLTTRATILLSADGNHIRIPNATVFKAVIVNYSRNVERRFQFDVGIDAGQDLQVAQALALQTLDSIESILSEPKPMVTIEELGDFNILIRIYGWTDQQRYSFLKVRSEAIRQIKQAFDQADINMPEPIYQIKIENESSIDLQHKKVSKQKDSQPIDKQRMLLAHSTADVSTEDSIEEKVAEEHKSSGNENLLSKNAAQE